MANHKDLNVWKDSMILAKDIYNITRNFPKDELYGLTSQIRRCSISVPSNIAEGAARNGDKEFIQFLYIALGSLSEMETQILLSIDFGYLKNDELIKKIVLIRKNLIGLIKYLKNK